MDSRAGRRMAPPARKRRWTGPWARAAVAAALVVVALGGWATTEAAAAEPDPIYAEAGIRYPEGFDLNTLADVRGRVLSLDSRGQGPVRFEVDNGTDRYTVLASPQWYWSDMDPGLVPGVEVVVRGSKSLGTNGRLYVIAQELRLTASGRRIAFRDPAGGPLWMGRAPQGGGGGARTPGSMGPAMGPRTGGMGRPGGMGHH